MGKYHSIPTFPTIQLNECLLIQDFLGYGDIAVKNTHTHTISCLHGTYIPFFLLIKLLILWVVHWMIIIEHVLHNDTSVYGRKPK